jgi:formate dehydrogenase major subunit
MRQAQASKTLGVWFFYSIRNIPKLEHKERSRKKHMDLSRRHFLKTAGLGLSGLFAAGALKEKPVLARTLKEKPLIKQIGESNTICPYDGSGCGFIVAARDGKVENIEGDPDHPINRGGGCAKGQSIRQLAADNPRRLKHPLYRAPGATDWEEKDWGWTIDRIARNIKKTRDATFQTTNSEGRAVNRTTGIANLGGAALDNEECYLLSKMARGLGIVYLEHQARI